MTPGQEALAEAARLETARIYSQLQREHKQPAFEAEAQAVLDGMEERNTALDRAVSAGWSNSRMLTELECSYGQIRVARKRAMKRLGAA